MQLARAGSAQVGGIGRRRPCHVRADDAKRRAELNPAVASIVATAAHVSGFLESSPEDLEVATNLFEPGRRRLEYASALEDLGVNRVATNRDAGVDALSRALAEYVGIGAAWDVRRVRRRLRELGVRRRIVPAEPELTGWAAITEPELAVARLVAEGLTNREVAGRLFVSPKRSTVTSATCSRSWGSTRASSYLAWPATAKRADRRTLDSSWARKDLNL